MLLQRPSVLDSPPPSNGMSNVHQPLHSDRFAAIVAAAAAANSNSAAAAAADKMTPSPRPDHNGNNDDAKSTDGGHAAAAAGATNPFAAYGFNPSLLAQLGGFNPLNLAAGGVGKPPFSPQSPPSSRTSSKEEEVKTEQESKEENTDDKTKEANEEDNKEIQNESEEKEKEIGKQTHIDSKPILLYHSNLVPNMSVCGRYLPPNQFLTIGFDQQLQ